MSGSGHKQTKLTGALCLLVPYNILDAYHKAKTQRPHAKSRHGSSFSAIKMQRLPNRLLAAHKSCEITPQWLARIEMDMFFFDSTNVTFATTGGPPPFIQTVNSRNVVVKLGLSYKLF
jgi:hypothetical protein